MYASIPTYKNESWTTTDFETKDDWTKYLINLFKEPGQYDFDDVALLFNEQAVIFNKQGFYCDKPFRSKDFNKYWEDQKLKCRVGVLYHGKKNVFYLSRDYYMWLNFLPIFDKEEKKYGFAKIRDAQYHMALYEILAELHNKHVAILKKRQIASSYFHMAKLLNQFWFEEGSICKIGASLKDYINDKGSWKFLDEYKTFLNEHTAWYRPCTPEKVLLWEQKIEVRINNRKTNKGLMSKIQGASFEKNATTGVGGPCTYFFHEEAGINPQANDIYAVETNLMDDKDGIGIAGLFIPEQWSMPPYIDKFGNSLVKESLKAIEQERGQWQKDLAPEQYQLRISQKPINIAEAFAYRKAAVFPQGVIAEQQKRIEDKTYSYEFIELERDSKGIIAKRTKKLPITTFPVKKKLEDKTGCLIVWERPIDNPAFGTYYASIDPVSEGKTTTSDSLCSIFVYKNPIEITRDTPDGQETFIEKDKIVASWCGRFDDINKTHERLELIIEWYKAWTIVENNISLFIQHMIAKRKQKYLVPKQQVLFLKDLGSNASVFAEYGWKNTGTLFKNHLISYAIEYIREAIDEELDDNGEVISQTLGVERIPDKMLLTEMSQYYPGLNVDRLVAFAALVAFARVQQSNRGYLKRKESDKSSNNLENSKNLYKLSMNPFKNIGRRKNRSNGNTSRRSPFKNIK